MKFNYYDIESLKNLFTLANYKEQEDEIDLYYLLDEIDLDTITSNLKEDIKEDNTVDENEISEDDIVNEAMSNMENLNHASTITDKDLIESKLFEDIKATIYRQNPAFKGNINLYNLRYKDANEHLAKTFGACAVDYINGYVKENDKRLITTDKFKITATTDKEYDEEKDAYFFGFNSFSYDTTMLALYFYEVFNADRFLKTEAKIMEQYNQELFSDEYKGRMYNYLSTEPLKMRLRQNMVRSGRYIDVTKLNEGIDRIALKKLLGMLGYQILESDKLTVEKNTIYRYEDFLETLAYNVSDVVYLSKLLHQPTYYSKFTVKRDLVKKYPEIVYQSDFKNELTDKQRPDAARIESTSADLVSKILSPFGKLDDIETVSFDYPHPDICKQLNIKRINVLEEAKLFFYENVKNPIARRRFDEIYDYYKSIEGKNFNSSRNYVEKYGPNEVHTLNQINPPNTNLPYFDKDGNPTSCFVNFTTGGIHGAEFNMLLYKEHLLNYLEEKRIYDALVNEYPDATELYNLKDENGKYIKEVNIETENEVYHIKIKDWIKSSSTRKKAQYKEINKKKPLVFKKSIKDGKNNFKLNDSYKFTSASITIHEDFASYYPNLLRRLKAFYNEILNYDRYGEIYDEKQRLGALLKDKTLEDSKRVFYKSTREGTKLALNAASGAADANYENPILMNNNIISMRIIGQLFSWRIGQAQTLAGARIISTNTDGLYSCLEEELNNKILDQQSKIINVDIDPELMYLVSKDSNNRIEIKVDKDHNLLDIIGANGASLTHFKGPNPNKSLSHPALIDRVIGEYLFKVVKEGGEEVLYNKFDRKLCEELIMEKLNDKDHIKAFTFFQNIIAASRGSFTFPFGVKSQSELDLNDTNAIAQSPDLKILQHYNRIFIMKDNTPNTYHLNNAIFKKISKSSQTSRMKKYGFVAREHDPLGLKVLKENGISEYLIKTTKDREANVQKVTKIDPNWFIYINNHDLYYMPEEEIQFIKENLDIEKYINLVEDEYNNNWKNTKPSIKEEDFHEDLNMYIYDTDTTSYLDTLDETTLAEYEEYKNTGDIKNDTKLEKIKVEVEQLRKELQLSVENYKGEKIDTDIEELTQSILEEKETLDMTLEEITKEYILNNSELDEYELERNIKMYNECRLRKGACQILKESNDIANDATVSINIKIQEKVMSMNLIDSQSKMSVIDTMISNIEMMENHIEESIKSKFSELLQSRIESENVDFMEILLKK